MGEAAAVAGASLGLIVGMLAINAAILVGTIWLIVTVLQHMNVL